MHQNSALNSLRVSLTPSSIDKLGRNPPIYRTPEQFTGGLVKGQTRVEYLPYERSTIEYQEVIKKIQVPIVKKVTDYYAVETQINYVPQIIQEIVIDYMPVNKYTERIEYKKIEKQVIVPQKNISFTQQGNQSTRSGLKESVSDFYPGHTDFYLKPKSQKVQVDDRIPLGIRTRILHD